MSPVPSSLNRVFSVPELAESVAQYLRPRELLTLGTLCRTLYHAFPPSLTLSLPSSTLLSAPDHGLETLVSIAPRVRILKLILHLSEEDQEQQQRLLEVDYSRYRAVQQVHIEYCDRTIGVLEEVLLKLPSFQKLSITFQADIDATVIFSALIARSKAIAEQRSLYDAEARLSCPCSALQSLSISHLDGFGYKAVDQITLLQALQACPGLRALELKGVSLSSHQDDASAPEFAKAESYAMPNMKALKLTDCMLSECQLSPFDRLFPNLSELEMSGCSGTWHLAFEGNHQSTASIVPTGALAEDITNSKALFPELRRLVLWLEQVPCSLCLWSLVAGRPHLTDLETDILSRDREELFRFAWYCSGVETGSALTGPHTGDSTSLLNTDVQSSVQPGSSETVLNAQSKGTASGASTTSRPRNRFKRLAIQTYVRPPLDTLECEQFYGALAFRELEYVFILRSELSISMFPFAKTLTSLHLGGPKDDLPATEFVKWKHILRQLPRLENLKIDRYLDSFEIFEGLGREPLSRSPDLDNGDGASPSSPSYVDWYGEAPFLIHLDISLRLPLTTSYSPGVVRTWIVGTGERRVSTILNVEELQIQVLDRFRFLEDVTVQLLDRSRPASKKLEEWSSKRELSEGGRQKCKVSFVFN